MAARRKPDGPLSIDERNELIIGFRNTYKTAICIARKNYYKYTKEAIKRAGFDEVEQACWLSVVNAARLFDPSRKVKFVTFAGRHMQDALKTIIRSYKRWFFLSYTEVEYGDRQLPIQ